MGKLFDLENPVMRGLSRLADMMILNLLTLLLCLPVFTAGSALTAMYYVELKWARKEEGYTVRPFFQQFKDNFKQATGEWLIMLVIVAVLAPDLFMFRQAPDAFPKVLRYLVQGLSYGKIAEAMGVEVTTVKYHVTNMLQKTNLENKLQLALAVSEAKMIADLAEE